MRNTIRKRVTLNEDTVDWFHEHYPEASLDATLSMLFEKFREVSTMTPKQYAEVAVNAFREELGS